MALKTIRQDSQQNAEKSNCPEGWVMTNIGDIVILNPPKPPQDALPFESPVTFVPMPAIDAYYGKITVPTERPFGSVRKGYTAFQENDVIFAKITPCMENGKSAIVRALTNGLGFGSTEFHVLRSNGAVIPDYLFYYLRQESFRKAAEAEMTGSVGQKRVPVNFLKNALIPLPPRGEQKRIVAKVEELLARVNVVRERLANVKEILKRFRQSVLSAACSGRLTEDWRNNQVDLESAKVLLKRLWEKHPKWSKNSLSEKVDLMNIPESWAWATVGQIGDVITGNTPSKKETTYFGGPIPFFKPADLNAGYYVKNSIDSLSEEGAKLARVLPSLAIMVTCIGATIGKTGLARVSGATNQQINSIVTDANFVLPQLLFWMVTSTFFQDQIKAKASETTLPILNKGRFENLPLPLPPIAEQREIVRRVELFLGGAYEIEKRVTTASQRAERLIQTILAKAFRGDLVPTEAELARREGRSYDSAAILLERIRKAKEKADPD